MGRRSASIACSTSDSVSPKALNPPTEMENLGNVASGALGALLDGGEEVLAQVLLGHEAVRAEAIRTEACDLGHTGANRGEGDLRQGVVDWAGIEGRSRKGEAIVVRDVVRFLAFLPSRPNGTHHADVVLHPPSGRGPGTAEALDVVAADLAPEADVDSALAQLLEVPGGLGHNKRGAGERDGDGRGDLQLLAVLGGEGHRQDGVVLQLAGGDPVEASGLGALHLLLDVPQPGFAEAGGDLHYVLLGLGIAHGTVGLVASQILT